MLCSVARLYVDAKARTKAKAYLGGQGLGTGNIAGAAGDGDAGDGDAGADGSGDVTGCGEMLASVGMEFDTYLSALGLAPPAALSSMGSSGGDSGIGGGNGWNMPSPGASGSGSDLNPETTTSNTGISQTTQLGNWFSGNQYMMGLLEEDLSLIDFSGWS